MRRFWLQLTLCLLVSCVESTTSPTSMAGPSTTGLHVTTTSAPPSAGAQPRWPGVGLLVVNDDGVFSIDPSGGVEQLVEGRVAYAVDDTRGGLLFQVERGRSPGRQWDSEVVWDTRVWWVPKGAHAAQELLVPTPGAAHDLELHDAYLSDEGHLMVVYVRNDSTMDPEIGWFAWVDSLRTYDVETGVVTRLWDQFDVEMQITRVSASAGLISATHQMEVGEWCFFLDPDAARRPGYDPDDWDRTAVTVEGAPTADHQCDPSGPSCCTGGCVLSPGGDLLAYVDSCEGVTVVDRRQHTRTLLTVTGVGIREDTGIYMLALTDRNLIVNHDGRATLVDLETGSQQPLPITGLARFTTAPIYIDGPLASPPTAGTE